jgi:RHS repeat-associated protein
MSLPGGSAIDKEFDALGRMLSTILRDPQYATLNAHYYEYNGAHQRTRQTFTFGNYTDYSYDKIGQLETAKGYEADETPRLHEQMGYRYDAAWNLNSRTNNGFVQTFNVNSLNELTAIGREGNYTVAGSVSATPTSVTVKDNVNSPQSATVYSDNTFALQNVPLLDGNNAFTAVAEDSLARRDTNTVTSWLPSTVTCDYDVRGNLTNDGHRFFAFDDENQLTSVIVTNGPGDSTKSDFFYDGRMRRRVRREYVWGSGIWNFQSEIKYVYDGNLAIQERWFTPQVSTNVAQDLVTYTRGNDLSGTFQGAGGIGGMLARSCSAAEATLLYHADGNGNISALASAIGILQGRYLYDPCGNTLAVVGSAAEANPWRFSSKEWHVPSGLYYYLYRHYSSELQRWLGKDLIAELGGINLYSFANNRPLTVLDAFGLSGTITIHTIDTGSNSSSGAIKGSHSWVTYEPDGGVLTSFGTFGPRTVYENSSSGLYQNVEVNEGMTPDHTRAVHIEDDAEQNLLSVINDYNQQGTGAWRPWHPCTSFAHDAWEAATGEDLAPGSWLPSSLGHAIDVANEPPRIIIQVPPSFGTKVNTPSAFQLP